MHVQVFYNPLQFPQLNPPKPNMHLKGRKRICDENFVHNVSVFHCKNGNRSKLTEHRCHFPACSHPHILKQQAQHISLLFSNRDTDISAEDACEIKQPNIYKSQWINNSTGKRKHFLLMF